jgi:CitMHS family citrate-Mg2+:H+ or citrate-Ca2+:H+ symporter
MLAFFGFAMVVVFMYLIMTNKVSALLALILIPTLFGVLAGFSRDMGPMMLEGIRNLAPTGIMLIFAILFFGIMIDAGLFEPLVKGIVKWVKGDPLKIVLATAGLALLVSLDGDGSSMYLIVVGAMLPLYRRVKINPLILTCVLMQSSHVMNTLPWGGPTARAAASLGLPINDIFLPLILPMILTMSWVLFMAYYLGKKEQIRLGVTHDMSLERAKESYEDHEQPVISDRHRKLLPVNLGLTILLMVSLVLNLLPLSALFMIGFSVAMIINYPSRAEQAEKLRNLAGNALPVAAMVFAAGIFTGILSGTKMVDAMANSTLAIIPDSLGAFMGVVIALLSIPFTFFMSNDAFYFGLLPVLTKAAQSYGFTTSEIGVASIIGQQLHLLSPLVPSTYLLTGLVKVDFGTHQRFTLPWAAGSAIVMLVAAVLTGAVPLYR